MTEELDPETAVTVGRVIAPHGLRGDVKVAPLTDFPERFERGSSLWLGGSKLLIERCRWAGKLVYLKFAGVDDRTGAENLRGGLLQATRAHDLAEGTFYVHDVIGLDVRDRSGARLGEVTDVLFTGANDVYVVAGERGELLLPATGEVVLEIDPGRRVMTVDVVEGLQWEPGRGDRARSGPRRPSGQGRGSKV